MTNDELLHVIYKDMQGMKQDMQGMKQDMQGMKQDIQETKHHVTGIQVHLENVTDKNISILAENHLNLIDKLNQTVKVTDKDLLNEIKMNILTEKVSILENEIEDIKSKIA